MDYIFKDWEKKLSAFEDSVEKELKDIRQCKEDIQQLKAELTNQIAKGQYIRDDQRLILSAPEVIIGNLDPNGLLYSDAGSAVVIRGTEVSLQGVGDGGKVDTRASTGWSMLSQACRRWSAKPAISSSRATMPREHSLLSPSQPPAAVCVSEPTRASR